MSTPVAYVPRSGSKGALALQLLSEGQMTAADLGTALEIDSGIVGATLAGPLKHGLIVKRLENNRAIYSLPDDEGVATDTAPLSSSSSAPSSDAIAHAHPFGSMRKGPGPRKLQSLAASSTPQPMQIPRFTGRERDEVEPVRDPSIVRFGVFSDGVLVIEAGAARIELDTATVQQLRCFLQILAS